MLFVEGDFKATGSGRNINQEHFQLLNTYLYYSDEVAP